MSKKTYKHPQTECFDVTPQTIVCTSVEYGGSTEGTRGDVPARKVTVLYV